VSTPAQLRIAARIHYALKGLLGEGIDIAAMLDDPAEAREVLFVCRASGNATLVALADLFFAESEVARPANRTSLPKPKPKHEPVKTQAAPQDAAWSRNTSGFGPPTPGAPSTKSGPRMGWLRHLSLRFMR